MLLAKSDPEVSIEQHTEEVCNCADSIICALKPYLDIVDFQLDKSIRIAAQFHDIGKIASGMQKVLRNKKGCWNYRHEILSAAILISIHVDKKYPLSVAAILTHHKTLDKLVDMIGVNIDSSIEERFLKEWNKILLELNENWEWLIDYVDIKNPIDGCLNIKDTLKTSSDIKDIRCFANNLYSLITNNKETMTDNLNSIKFHLLPLIIARGILMAAVH